VPGPDCDGPTAAAPVGEPRSILRIAREAAAIQRFPPRHARGALPSHADADRRRRLYAVLRTGNGNRHLYDRAQFLHLPGLAAFPGGSSRRRRRSCTARRASELGSTRAPGGRQKIAEEPDFGGPRRQDRKSTRLNSTHVKISYAV